MPYIEGIRDGADAMPDIAATPPERFGLSWVDHGPRSTKEGPRRLFQAPSNTLYDAAYTGASRRTLQMQGYGSTRVGNAWHAQFWAKPTAAELAAEAAAHAAAVEASRATDADV